jgi:hypothetical protein
VTITINSELPVPGFANGDYDEISFLMFEVNDPAARSQFKPVYLSTNREGEYIAVSHLSRAWLTGEDRANEVADELNRAGVNLRIRVKQLIGSPVRCTVKVITYKLRDPS